MVWTCKRNARKLTATKNFRMGTRGNAKKGKTQRELDGVRRSITNRGLTEEDTRDRDAWSKFWAKERPLCIGQVLT
jgi:hypothetical protein